MAVAECLTEIWLCQRTASKGLEAGRRLGSRLSKGFGIQLVDYVFSYSQIDYVFHLSFNQRFGLGLSAARGGPSTITEAW